MCFEKERLGYTFAIKEASLGTKTCLRFAHKYAN